MLKKFNKKKGRREGVWLLFVKVALVNIYIYPLALLEGFLRAEQRAENRAHKMPFSRVLLSVPLVFFLRP